MSERVRVHCARGHEWEGILETIAGPFIPGPIKPDVCPECGGKAVGASIISDPDESAW